jgi:glycosyltransferase involved in cell wall biosynthesis
VARALRGSRNRPALRAIFPEGGGMTRLTFSIVITCFNYDRYVGNAIDSALAQSRPADEIIVLDDGSTDNSRHVIAGYGDRIRPVFKSNEGYKATVNRGFRETSGDVVLFLDADDALHPDALERVEKVWRPGLAKVQFDLDIIDGEGRALGRRFAGFRRDITGPQTALEFRKTGTYRWPVTTGNAHARKFLEQVMPLTPPVGHDGVLNTIAPLYGEIHTIAKPLGQYRLHGRNMSMTDAQGAHKRHPDFARQIGFRRREFDMLRDHAKARGVDLPQGDLLDNELVFVNYRLMARKIGQPYECGAANKSWTLWQRGIGLAFAAGIDRPAIVNSVWLTLLALAPRGLANLMVLFRFNRVEVFRSAKSRIDAIRALAGPGMRRELP